MCSHQKSFALPTAPHAAFRASPTSQELHHRSPCPSLPSVSHEVLAPSVNWTPPTTMSGRLAEFNRRRKSPTIPRIAREIRRPFCCDLWGFLDQVLTQPYASAQRWRGCGTGCAGRASRSACRQPSATRKSSGARSNPRSATRCAIWHALSRASRGSPSLYAHLFVETTSAPARAGSGAWPDPGHIRSRLRHREHAKCFVMTATLCSCAFRTHVRVALELRQSSEINRGEICLFVLDRC